LQARAELERRRRLALQTTSRADWRRDFLAFVGLCDIVPKDGHRGKLRPSAIQLAFEIERSGRDIILKPRQIGMTTWELVRDVWYFLTKPGARVVVVVQSMSDDGALREATEKLKVIFDGLELLGLIPGVVREALTHWTFRSRNASLRVVGAGASEAAAAKKGRSGTIHRLHITELAFFEFARETLNAMLECVPAPEHGTEIVIESTPNGASGLFFELYQAAKSRTTAYKSHFFRWTQHAEYCTPLRPDERIAAESLRERELVEKYSGSAEQLKWYRAKVAEKGQDLADQEYPLDEETCWLSAGRLFFDKTRTQQLYADALAPIETKPVGREGSHGVIRIWKHRQDGRRYVLIVDPSEGVGGDPGAGVVLDRGSGEHVATIHGQFATYEMARVAAELGKSYWGARSDGTREPALIVVERNNHGHAVLQGLIREQRYPYLYADRDKRAGWNNGEPSRAAALAALQEAHFAKHWKSPEKESLAEMLKFIVLANGRAEAAPGAHDDLVLAHAIGWDVVCRPQVDRYVPPGMVA
jgi:hypothetical protein